MEPSSTRAGMPWLWQGFVFAVLLALIRVIFLITGHFIHLAVFDFTINAMINILLMPFLYLVVAVFVGLRASQQTGKMIIGVLAGLVTALFNFFASSIYIVVLLNSTGHKVGPFFFFSPSIAFFSLVSMLPALVAGLVGGIIGGAVGSAERRAQSGTTTTISTDTSRRRADQPPS